MPKHNYTVTIRSSEYKGDPDYYQVTAEKAASLQADWDAHKNVRIGDKVLTWQSIVSIAQPPAQNLIQAPKMGCSECEGGWTYQKDIDPCYGGLVASPCGICNPKAQAEIRDYIGEMEKTTNWQTFKAAAERRTRNTTLPVDKIAGNELQEAGNLANGHLEKIMKLKSNRGAIYSELSDELEQAEILGKNEDILRLKAALLDFF